MEVNAREIMTSPVICAEPEATLADVVKLMAESNISGVPIVDCDRKPIGMISETDIVNYAGQNQAIKLVGSSGWMSPYTQVTSNVLYGKGYEMLSKTLVKNIMAKNVVKVKENTSALEIARLMNRKNINRVPVVDSDGKLTGIITRANIVKFLAES